MHLLECEDLVKHSRGELDALNARRHPLPRQPRPLRNLKHIDPEPYLRYPLRIGTTGEIEVENHRGVSMISIASFAWAIHARGDGHA